MRITTLIENLVYDKGLVAEHGLSLYIELAGKNILFDTGQSGLFMHNASQLGVKIEDVDILVLSHGHYDHTGGVKAFLSVNKKADIYTGKGFFDAKYSSRNGFIGAQLAEEEFNGRLKYVEDVISLDELYIMPKAHLFFPDDLNNRGLQLGTEQGFIDDTMEEEIYLVIKSKGTDHINIISACSHRGITNICQSAIEYFNCKVGLILGGFHTKGESDKKVDTIIDYLKSVNPLLLGVCHCTGVEHYGEFSHSGLQVFYNFTGKITTI